MRQLEAARGSDRLKYFSASFLVAEPPDLQHDAAMRLLRSSGLTVLILAGALGSAACSSDATPGSTPGEPDAADEAASDTGELEAAPADSTAADDTTTADTEPAADTVAMDTSTADSVVADSFVADTVVADSFVADTAMADTKPADAADAGTALTRARVFITGHSLTDNPLADHLAEISSSLSTDLKWNQQIGIGSPIRVRTKGNDPSASGWPGYSRGKNRVGSDMNVINELKSPATLGAGERYDTLVITERHDILGTIQWENTVGYTRHFHDRLIDGNPAGTTYLYHSWLSLSKTSPAAWIDHEKKALYAWECVSSRVNQTLALNAKPGRVITPPAGAALVALVERLVANTVPGITGTLEQRMNAIFSDDVHLTNLGSYYAALVTYSSIFRRSAVGAKAPTGASATAVASLQQIAWAYVSAYYAKPAFDTHTMAECRSYVAETVCPSFWNLLGTPGNITGCRNFFGNAAAAGNPFVDTATYTPLPAP